MKKTYKKVVGSDTSKYGNIFRMEENTIPNIKRAQEEADTVRLKYNSEGVSPFPYERITKDYKNLNISYLNIEDNVSGAILFDKASSTFNIFINSLKPKTRQHFTLAHELGHFFLHRQVILDDGGIVDGDKTLDGTKILFRLDDAKSTCLEVEANNFASSLIMPKELVIEAWERLKNIEDCANIFNVSLLAMTIRLTKLGLIKEE